MNEKNNINELNKRGFIKLYRCLTEKAIWKCSSPEQKVILITLLLMADHESNEWEWQGQKYKTEPGQFITSLKSIAEEAGKGITIQNVRTSLEKFEKYEFLTNESTKTGRLISIVNWTLYQAKKEKVTKELTNDQQSTNKELTTNKNIRTKEYKNINNIYNIYSPVINYLNEKCNTNYKATSSKTKTCIDARVNEGFALEDFKKVIDIKSAEWLNTDMAKYLRPETLFGPKFESYLNQGRSKDIGKFGNNIQFKVPERVKEDSGTKDLNQRIKELGII